MTTGREAAAGQELVGSGKEGSWLRRASMLIITLVVTLMLASTWLVLPYFVEGKAVLEDISDQVISGRSTQQRTLGQVMTRFVPGTTADGSEGIDVDALFGTPTYFARTASARVAARFELEKYTVFLVGENTHIYDINADLPNVVMLVDGVAYEPADMDGPIDPGHHRSTTVRFPRYDAAGREIITDDTREVKLIVSNFYDAENSPRELVWQMPINYPAAENVLSSPMIITALSAGLLSATLTPCLLQLLIVYMATLTGLSTEQLSRGRTELPAVTRRRMVMVALTFVFGFTAFYTAAGAIIGYAGKSTQIWFDAASREMAVGTGIIVILMGLWMGIKARAPIVCHLPMPKLMQGADKGGHVRSLLVSIAFSLGCMVCFSGAIVGTLLIYVGLIGSATIGAFILFVFSMGVALPFLAAAFFLSRTMSTMHWLSRYSPQIGFVSMSVIVAFGIVLLTDNFHVVSDMIYPWLRLK